MDQLSSTNTAILMEEQMRDGRAYIWNFGMSLTCPGLSQVILLVFIHSESFGGL